MRAQDQAVIPSQRRESVYTVSVEVEDINDQPPQFLQANNHSIL